MRAQTFNIFHLLINGHIEKHKWVSAHGVELLLDVHCDGSRQAVPLDLLVIFVNFHENLDIFASITMPNHEIVVVDLHSPALVFREIYTHLGMVRLVGYIYQARRTKLQR